MSTSSSSRSSSSGQVKQNRPKIWIALIVIVIVALAIYAYASWRAPDQIFAAYGQRSGLDAGRSVNGTAVFARMFEQESTSVSTWRRLSPRLQKADTIVWFPDDYSPPGKTQTDWFETWLTERYGRTLIYVGRDYDGKLSYWEDVKSQVPPEQVSEVGRRVADAKVEHSSDRIRLVESENGKWFSIDRATAPRTVTALEGPWSDLIDPAIADIKLGERYEFNGDADYKVEVLLAAPRGAWMWDDVEPLVFRVTHAEWPSGQILVVTNGSFLLNYPLVNHEHRQIAQKLIEKCNSRRDVVFLESGNGGPSILERDPDRIPPSALQMLMLWPVRVVTIHVVAIAVLLSFASFPLHGRPLRAEPPPRSDFENHLRALGLLLSQTEDVAYARERIQHYQDLARRDSGASHKEPATNSSLRTSLAAMSRGAQSSAPDNTTTANPEPAATPPEAPGAGNDHATGGGPATDESITET